LSEQLGMERERLHGWGLAQAVLSAWWDYQPDRPNGSAAFQASIGIARLLKQVPL
jgi:hypothetical protein